MECSSKYIGHIVPNKLGDTEDLKRQVHVFAKVNMLLRTFSQHVYHEQLQILVITRVSEVIMFSPCVFVCLSRCLSGRFNYEGLVPHKQYFAGTLLGISSCASYVSRTHDVIDDVTRSQKNVKFWNWHISVNIRARASIKSSKCRKGSWLSLWYVQLPV